MRQLTFLELFFTKGIAILDKVCIIISNVTTNPTGDKKMKTLKDFTLLCKVKDSFVWDDCVKNGYENLAEDYTFAADDNYDNIHAETISGTLTPSTVNLVHYSMGISCHSIKTQIFVTDNNEVWVLDSDIPQI